MLVLISAQALPRAPSTQNTVTQESSKSYPSTLQYRRSFRYILLTNLDNNLRDHLLCAPRHAHLASTCANQSRTEGIPPVWLTRQTRAHQALSAGLGSMDSDDDLHGPHIIVTVIEASTYTNLNRTHRHHDLKSRLIRARLPHPYSVFTRSSALICGAFMRHIWVQLFARAQAQYLFANSAEWAGKKPLGRRGRTRRPQSPSRGFG